MTRRHLIVALLVLAFGHGSANGLAAAEDAKINSIAEMFARLRS